MTTEEQTGHTHEWWAGAVRASQEDHDLIFDSFDSDEITCHHWRVCDVCGRVEISDESTAANGIWTLAEIYRGGMDEGKCKNEALLVVRPYADRMRSAYRGKSRTMIHRWR